MVRCSSFVVVVQLLLLPTAQSFSMAPLSSSSHRTPTTTPFRSAPAFAVSASSSSSRLYAKLEEEEDEEYPEGAAAAEEEDVPDDWTGEDLLDDAAAGKGDAAAASDLGLTNPVSSLDVVDDDDDDDDDAVVKMKSNDEEDDDDGDDDDLLDIDLEYEDEDVKPIVEKPKKAKKGGRLRPVRAQDYGQIVVDWNEEEDGIEYELEEHPDDPNFVVQKQMIDEAVEASERRRFDLDFNAYDYLEQAPEVRDAFDASDFMKRVQENADNIMLTEDDLASIDIESEMKKVPDLIDVPFPRTRSDKADFLERATGITDDDLIEMDRDIREIRALVEERNRTEKIMHRAKLGYEGMANETIDEMNFCLNSTMVSEGCPHNSTKWLLYDQDFNVTNLMLAAVKHNPDAPILLWQWYPQLERYERYQYVRDRDYDFTWEDVEAADLSELERYYQGFGYDKIPDQAPAENGIMDFEYLDEEEIKMAAFDHWFKDVYNPDADRIDLDDPTVSNADNIFTRDYIDPQQPDFPTWEEAGEHVDWWHNRTLLEEEEVDTEETRAYRDLNRFVEYDYVEDEEFEQEFRGHLVIACTAEDSDLEIAEKITERCKKEFGKAVYVETRVMGHARMEDNVFEIWLESYHIDLIHSKRRAAGNVEDWDGPAEVDNDQLEWLTERVKFLISDESRNSYRLYEEGYVS